MFFFLIQWKVFQWCGLWNSFGFVVVDVFGIQFQRLFIGHGHNMAFARDAHICVIHIPCKVHSNKNISCLCCCYWYINRNENRSAYIDMIVCEYLCVCVCVCIYRYAAVVVAAHSVLFKWTNDWFGTNICRCVNVCAENCSERFLHFNCTDWYAALWKRIPKDHNNTKNLAEKKET